MLFSERACRTMGMKIEAIWINDLEIYAILLKFDSLLEGAIK